MLKLLVRKYLQFYAENICLSKPVDKIIKENAAFDLNSNKQCTYFRLFGLILYIQVNNCSVFAGWVFLG